MRKPIRPSVRIAVFARDGFTCQYCGRSAPDVPLHVDHVASVARGGSNDPSNLITACKECNSGKGEAALDELALRHKHHSAAGSPSAEPNYGFEILTPRDGLGPARLRVITKTAGPGPWVDVTKREMFVAAGDDLLLLELYADKGGFDQQIAKWMADSGISPEEMDILEEAAAAELDRFRKP